MNSSVMNSKLKVKSPEDFWSGVIFIGLGLLAMYLSRNYPMGSALRMGPGYFPFWLGGIMASFGVIISGLSFTMELQAHEDIPWGVRPWIVLSASLVAFGVLMDYVDAGFVPSVVVLIVGSTLAHKNVHWFQTLMVVIFGTMFFVLLFIYLIGLPWPLFWWSY